MTDDLSVFWQNNGTAAALFYDLLARAQREAYDDDFLAQLAAYRTAGGDAGHADVFAAQYLVHHGETDTALICAERAYALRPVSYEVWRLLAKIYKACGRYTEALVMEGYAARLYETPISIADYPAEAITQEVLDRLSVAMVRPSSAPIATRMSYDSAEGLTATDGLFSGEFLPIDPQITPRYYVGVHAEQGMQGDRAWQMSMLRNALGISYFGAGDFIFDLMRADRVGRELYVEAAPEQESVLPIIGTVLPIRGLHTPQHVHVRTASLDRYGWLNVATPNFFRLNEPTEISSDADLIVGRPISVRHKATRRRLVLNILVDALPWQVLRSSFPEHMPQTARFFARGTVFDQHFSVAEYTFPALAAIETGMYPHHNQIFNNNVAVPLQADYVTLSERLRECGYATAQLMGPGDGIYTGVTRGYDRILCASYRQQNYEAVERAIRHLEGLGTGDHFINIHSADVHPYPSPLFQHPTPAQARLSLADRMTEPITAVPSPYHLPSPLNQEAFWMGVSATDRSLGTLFSYLEENYTPEEYLVSLYSDHGVSIFSPQPYIVDPFLTGAAWMMRGAGVPEGVVTDELTSVVDLYPALAHLLHFPVGKNVDGVLPKIFGGTGRDIAFSNSLYPGKPYFLAARSKEHTLCLETQETVGMDGTVDLTHANVAIYPRAHENEAGYAVDSPELRAFFYPRVREFLRGIGNNGEIFPLPTKG